MSFINSIIKAFVGDKSEKDVKALQPFLKSRLLKVVLSPDA
jgi:preprotein translocase subunit SecA